MEERLVDELEGQATDESRERYARAVERLIETLDDEERVIEAAVEQDFVCEMAERLRHRREGDVDLGDLEDLGPRRLERLERANITTLRDLVERDPEDVAQIADVDMAERWIAEANRILDR